MDGLMCRGDGGKTRPKSSRYVVWRLEKSYVVGILPRRRYLPLNFHAAAAGVVCVADDDADEEVD